MPVQERDDALALIHGTVRVMHLLNEGGSFPDDFQDTRMGVLMRGLLTRGAGVGRGVFGGTGRSMIDGFMV